MDTKALRYAIEDAKRFAKRAEELLEEAYASPFSEDENPYFKDADQKTLRRLSMDVTHAMKDFRDSLEIPSDQVASKIMAASVEFLDSMQGDKTTRTTA